MKEKKVLSRSFREWKEKWLAHCWLRGDRLRFSFGNIHDLFHQTCKQNRAFGGFLPQNNACFDHSHFKSSLLSQSSSYPPWYTIQNGNMFANIEA